LIPDRIEAGTYLAAAALTGGRIRLCNCPAAHLSQVLKVLRRAGCRVKANGEETLLERTGKLRPFAVSVAVYPGFPTDLQGQFAALAAMAPGKSVIRETIFESRFLHLAELQRMGADIAVDGQKIIVNGVPRLTGATVMASDLRASAALILAGLVAKGRTTVRRVYHLDRGYEDLVGKLRALGADIRRERE
jgi:UDP-N-acetylglucosamine 1-carboxyvinyltransferase